MLFSYLLIRYYLLVHVEDHVNVDMKSLRKKSLVTVWLTSIPLTILSKMAGILALSFAGWPEVGVGQISRGATLMASISIAVVVNLPDIVSVLIFVAIRRHFAQMPVQSPEGVEVHDDEMYGGIWVGGSGDYPLEAWPDNAEDHISSEEPDSAKNDCHEVKAAMRALKWHVRLCLIDVSFVVISYFGKSTSGTVLFYLFHMFSVFIVPFVVVTSSFKQFSLPRVCS